MKRLSLPILAFILAAAPLKAQGGFIIPEGVPSTIVHHKGYTVSFNEDLRIPNCVCYMLTPDDVTTEGVSRTDEFLPDPEIASCPESREYSRSGYDRGHMMPAADCKTSIERMRESFYLSNVCPQDHALNEGSWCDLEKQVRFWCKHWYKDTLWVACGPVVSKDCPRTASNIAVPSAFWKAVCRKDPRSGRWEAVGFIFPNNPTERPYKERRVSVDTIEALTGIDIFSDLDDYAEVMMEKDSSSNWKF